MILNVYKLTSHPQYKPDAKIIVAHSCESKAVEMAEEIVGCALSITQIGCGEFAKPQVIENTYKRNNYERN